MSPIERQCVSLWQQCIAALWRQRCGRCRCIGAGAGHHIVKRRFGLVKFDLKNGIYLCNSTCHPWAEQHPRDFMRWLGVEWPELLPADRQPEIVTRFKDDWRKLKLGLTEALQEIESDTWQLDSDIVALAVKIRRRR